MALTATATQGFEWSRYIERDEVIWVPGDPGDTYTKGDLVTFPRAEAGAAGMADVIAGDEVPYAVVMETVVCPAASGNPFPLFGPDGANPARGWGQIPDSVLKTLVAVRPIVPVGTPILRCTFADHHDDTVLSYSAPDITPTSTTVLAANDYPNGGLVYIYEGPGVGEWNIVDDYVHATPVLNLVRPTATALTSASKYIVLSGEAVTFCGAGFFGRLDFKSASSLETDDGVNNGNVCIYADARTISGHLKNLRVPVIPAGAFLMA